MLEPNQRRAVDELRSASASTRRATVAALEDILYEPLPVLDHGFVRVIDYLGDDAAVVQAARVSYGRGTKRARDDAGLVRYLMRHLHTTPFEMCEIKYHIKLPIFVARQWIRHRTANVNEYSARYSVVPDRFYHPAIDAVRRQSAGNRQGAQGTMDELTAKEFCDYLDRVEANYPEYQKLIDKGVARELARIGLPQSIYTEWYWKCDLHNTFHFLSLRMEEHAQQEIRDYANAMFAIIQQLLPVAAEAFLDYNFEAIHLSRLEVEAIRTGKELASDNKRENAEWEQKRKQLGL